MFYNIEVFNVCGISAEVFSGEHRSGRIVLPPYSAPDLDPGTSALWACGSGPLFSGT